MRIANLPWYDFQELRDVTDALWAGFARHFARAGVQDVPSRLTRTSDHAAQWRRRDLLLSQACGYDVLYDQAEHLAVIATPSFDVPGCPSGSYRSAIVVRERDGARDLAALRGTTCAINEPSSHSGTNSLRPLVAPLARDGRFFREVIESGDHVTSLELVASSRADVAAIDLVVWEICRSVAPARLEGLRVLAFTEPAPAPPWVTSAHATPAELERLREGLLAALADPELKPAREALRIGGATVLPEGAYRSLAAFEEPARAGRYLELPAPRLSPLSALAGGSAARVDLQRPRASCCVR